jgi:hypothetical protein
MLIGILCHSPRMHTGPVDRSTERSTTCGCPVSPPKEGVTNFGINPFYGPCRTMSRVANALAALEAALPVKFFTRRLCVIFLVPPATVFLRIFLI